MSLEIPTSPAPVRPWVALSTLARAQGHAFSHAQAAAAGLTSDHLLRGIRQGRLWRPEPRVYVMRPSPRGWLQDLWIAHLGAGPQSVVSHRSAAQLHGFDGISGTDRDLIELTIRKGSGYRRHLVHRTTDLLAVDIVTAYGLKVTSPARTLVDLGAVVDGDVLLRAVESAFRQGLSPARLQWRLDVLGRRGRPGVAALREVLAARPAGVVATHSELETRFLQLVRRSGLEEPERQYRVYDGNGVFVAQVDWSFTRQKVLVELDGFGFHSDAAAFRHDRARQNKLVLLGYTVLRFTWHDVVDRPDTTMATLTQALAA